MADQETGTSDSVASASRGLTVLQAPKVTSGPIVRVRHDPAFVAQLIATVSDAPQTRRLRRAEPVVAKQFYRTTAGYGRQSEPSMRLNTSRTV